MGKLVGAAAHKILQPAVVKWEPGVSNLVNKGKTGTKKDEELDRLVDDRKT
jgi:hypothetical protein